MAIYESGKLVPVLYAQYCVLKRYFCSPIVLLTSVFFFFLVVSFFAIQYFGGVPTQLLLRFYFRIQTWKKFLILKLTKTSSAQWSFLLTEKWHVLFRCVNLRWFEMSLLQNYLILCLEYQHNLMKKLQMAQQLSTQKLLSFGAGSHDFL